MTEKLRPARVPPPGRLIQREIEAREWTQKDLADIMGRPVHTINEIIRGTKRITPETALELAKAFGTSAELWLNLEANYRLHLAEKGTDEKGIERKSRLYSIAPVAELIKRGWIRKHETLDALERELCDFLHVASLDDAVALNAVFRHARAQEPETYALVAWVRRAEQLARQQEVAPFDRERLTHAMPELLTLAERAEDVGRVPETLAALGVYFVVVPHLPKTYVDGAAFTLDDGHPVIALSLRYDRIDAFWFTLLHELAHIVSGHEGLDIFNQDERDGDAQERVANKLASDWLLNPEALAAFVSEVKPYFSRAKVEAFAARQRRHPGIVVGRLHHDGDLAYSHLNGLCEKVSVYLWAARSKSSTPETRMIHN